MRLLVTLLLPLADGSRLPPLSRRGALAASCAAALPPALANAEQRGAEDPYAIQRFGSTVCTRRSPLGACQEEAPASSVEAPAAPTLRVLPIDKQGVEDNAYIQSLLKRSEENKEANRKASVNLANALKQ